MPEASDGGDPSTTSTLVPNQLASLVPTFDPAKDEILEYTKKVSIVDEHVAGRKMDRTCNKTHFGLFRYRIPEVTTA